MLYFSGAFSQFLLILSGYWYIFCVIPMRYRYDVIPSKPISSALNRYSPPPRLTRTVRLKGFARHKMSEQTSATVKGSRNRGQCAEDREHAMRLMPNKHFFNKSCGVLCTACYQTSTCSARIIFDCAV